MKCLDTKYIRESDRNQYIHGIVKNNSVYAGFYFKRQKCITQNGFKIKHQNEKIAKEELTQRWCQRQSLLLFYCRLPFCEILRI